MSALDFVKFQKSESGYGTGSADSPSTSIKISENVEASAQISTRNFQNTKTDDLREIQLLKLGRQSRCRNWSSWCFAFVFLWALMTTVFCLGFFMRSNNNEKDADFEKMLKDVQLILIDLRNATGNQLTSDLKTSLTSQIHEPLVANSDQKVNLSLHNHFQDLNPESHHNVNSSEFAKVKGQLDDIVQKLSDLDMRINSDHVKLEQKFRAQHGEIKNKLNTDVDGLKGQLDDLKDQLKTPEVNSARDEVKKEISEVKKQIKTRFDQLQVQIEQINVSSSAPESAPAVTLTPPLFSTLRFFEHEHYRGAWFSPTLGWEKKCIEMPEYMRKQASSVKLSGHCLLVCSTTNCGQPFVGKNCIDLHPDSSGMGNLGNFDVNYNDQIVSFRQCQKT